GAAHALQVLERLLGAALRLEQASERQLRQDVVRLHFESGAQLGLGSFGAAQLRVQEAQLVAHVGIARREIRSVLQLDGGLSRHAAGCEQVSEGDARLDALWVEVDGTLQRR